MAYSLYDAAVTPCIQQLGALVGIDGVGRRHQRAAKCSGLRTPDRLQLATWV